MRDRRNQGETIGKGDPQGASLVFEGMVWSGYLLLMALTETQTSLFYFEKSK